jgi:hypothetical protein
MVESAIAPVAPVASPEVRVLYFVPADLVPDSALQDRILQASRDMHRWYADHTDNGRTFNWGSTVQFVQGQSTASYYQADLWSRVLVELGNRGFPLWSPGLVFSIWVQGGQLFAGGATTPGWSGAGMVGTEAFLQEGCQPTHQSNWPCTPVGAMAHELGHAFGMPHPDTAGGWNGVYLNGASLMGSHWNFPERDPRNYIPDSPWGLLNYERDHLRYNPVFGTQGSPYLPPPGELTEKPALPNPALNLDVGLVNPTQAVLAWNNDGASQYYAYWSTTPKFGTYSALSGSPTTGLSLTHNDTGNSILYFKVFEIPLSN